MGLLLFFSSTLLFGTSINDLHDRVNDDVLLYRTISSSVDCEILQDLNILNHGTENSQVLFHLFKCELKDKNYALKQREEEQIRSVLHIKYLGAIIDEHLTFNELIFLQRNIHLCPQLVKQICFKSMVRPILEYSCVVWSPHTQKHQVSPEESSKVCY